MYASTGSREKAGLSPAKIQGLERRLFTVEISEGRIQTRHAQPSSLGQNRRRQTKEELMQAMNELLRTGSTTRF
jgi:hypothetical protein